MVYLCLLKILKSLNMRKIFLLLVVASLGLSANAQNEGRPDLPGDLVVNFGSNSFSSSAESLKITPLGSISWGIYYSKNISMGKSFSFYPGIGLGMEKYGWENEVTLGFDADQNVTLDTISDLGSIKKTRLAANYLEVPLELRYFPMGGTEDGKGFFIAIGGSLGIRYESHTKVKYEDALEDNFLIKQRNDFDLNPFRVGAIARIGTKGINGFYRMYFTELFDSGRGPDGNATAFTLGISINAF